MIMPMLPRVPPNPLEIDEIMLPLCDNPSAPMYDTFSRGIPPIMPTITVARISARNACTFVKRTSPMSTTMPTRRPISIWLPLTICSMKKISFR